MKRGIFSVKENQCLAKDTYLMILTGDTEAITGPGQFVNIALEGNFLRRPISVCDYKPGELTLIYKIVGRGTAQMRTMPAGTKLDILTGLGNGYDLEPSGDKPLLLGFNRAEERFFQREFEELGVAVTVATADGSVGVKGFVTDAMPQDGYTYIYTCGPEPMLRAVYDKSVTPGQFSFEERMGCGFGACMGCTCQTKYGNKRICREGPVLEKEEILW